ncbi:MAG: hypothetical protein ACKPKO_17260, partial [Candidatus Fonsibacter sp.]
LLEEESTQGKTGDESGKTEIGLWHNTREEYTQIKTKMHEQLVTLRRDEDNTIRIHEATQNKGKINIGGRKRIRQWARARGHA